MPIAKPGRLLRVFVGESDQKDGRPVYEAVVEKARELGLAGATVLRGPMGFGSRHRVHTAKILRLSEDLPVVVEIVDEPERIDALVAQLDGLVDGGLATLEDVTVLAFGPGGRAGGG